jgi:hypothetical protein
VPQSTASAASIEKWKAKLEAKRSRTLEDENSKPKWLLSRRKYPTAPSPRGIVISKLNGRAAFTFEFGRIFQAKVAGSEQALPPVFAEDADVSFHRS